VKSLVICVSSYSSEATPRELGVSGLRARGGLRVMVAQGAQAQEGHALSERIAER
jgi:hypothetical protein